MDDEKLLAFDKPARSATLPKTLRRSDVLDFEAKRRARLVREAAFRFDEGRDRRQDNISVVGRERGERHCWPLGVRDDTAKSELSVGEEGEVGREKQGLGCRC